MDSSIILPNELDAYLLKMPGWTHVNGAIEKTFLFADFKQALAFIVQAGILAEQADHHPEIYNVYNKVVIRLNTHSVQAITQKDTSLAAALDKLVVL
jgi:4a-hydroxytetrahydrobiopterin dehydratase